MGGLFFLYIVHILFFHIAFQRHLHCFFSPFTLPEYNIASLPALSFHEFEVTGACVSVALSQGFVSVSYCTNARFRFEPCPVKAVWIIRSSQTKYLDMLEFVVSFSITPDTKQWKQRIK
jgi:hypothetical protein